MVDDSELPRRSVITRTLHRITAVGACREYGQSYIDAWAKTQNYRLWRETVDESVRDEIPEGCVLSGATSVWLFFGRILGVNSCQVAYIYYISFK